MTAASLLLVLAPLFAADAVPSGTLLTYRGTMVPAKDDGDPTQKQFELLLLSAAEADGQKTEKIGFHWVLDEKGRGQWSWLDHYGLWELDPTKRDDGTTGPALLYQRDDGKSIVPLFEPLFTVEAKLERGAAWSEGRMDYRVTGESKTGERETWEIDSRTPYGHKRTLWVAKDAPQILALRETVFIGQGQQHELKLELVESKSLSADEQAQAMAAFAKLAALREKLNRDPRAEQSELADEQLAVLRTDLPKIIEAAAATPLEELLASAQKDLQSQKGRAGAVAALREKIVGQKLGEFSLKDLAGKEVTHADLKNKVTVLHFWQYRDTPLEEPYGQVGYLDFLLRKRGAAGLQILGVHVDERLAEEDTRRGSVASARKLKAFMNLSYPIVLDDGELLKKLGDPRSAGGKLPVFFVIGRDGSILEYHAGLYDVKPEAGLVELDALVKKALETK